MQTLNKNGFPGKFAVLPPDYMTINQNFSTIPQIYTKNHTISTKKISGKFLSFPEKLTLFAKFEQKSFSRDFEVLPPDYVRINQNFGLILTNLHTEPYHFDQK